MTYTVNIYTDDLVWHVFIGVFSYGLGYTTAVVMRG